MNVHQKNQSIKNQARTLICHIIYRLDYGGLENGLVNLINNLPEDRYQHAVICLTYATKFKDRIEKDNVKIIEIRKKEGKDLLAYLRVWRAIRALAPDIVHTRNIATLDMIVPAYLAGVKRFVHGEHGLDVSEITGKHSKYNYLRHISKWLVRNYIAVSQDLANWLREEIKVPADKISLIYNGVNTDLFRTDSIQSELIPAELSTGQKILIGTIGRLQPIKDQATLAKAFVILLSNNPELREKCRLVIIGDGSTRAEIQQILKDAGVEELAWLPGFIANPAQIYSSLDIFVLPSRREGISNTILEAMSSSLPVVATNVGGNTEIVQNNITGKIVPAENPQQMAEVLQEYINNPSMREEHGCTGRQQVEEKFSLDVMVHNYDKVYQALF